MNNRYEKVKIYTVMKQNKKRRKKRLKGWVKIVLSLMIVAPCLYFALDVYAEFNPFTSIASENDPSLKISYSALDHTFTDDNGQLVTNTSLVVSDGKDTHYMLTDENGVFKIGWYETDTGKYYYEPETGYLVTTSREIEGRYYTLDEITGRVLNNEWKGKNWYVDGQIMGTDTDTLLFIQGETGFYYLSSEDGGNKCINSSRTLADSREARFDENGKIVTNEVYVNGIYYFPLAEADVVAEETKLVPVSEYDGIEEDEDGIKLVNHRGYHVVAPENTLSAYKDSKENHYQYVETDIQMTADNIPVLLHDKTLKAMAGADVSINSLTLAEAQTYNIQGESITPFEEFLAYCKANEITPYIELKTETIETADQVKIIYDIVEKYSMVGKVQWISFSSELLRYVYQYDQTDRLGYVVGKSSKVSTVVSEAVSMQAEGMNIFVDAHYSKQDAYASALAEYNIPLEVWTVDSLEDLNNINSYVTGVTTDVITY